MPEELPTFRAGMCADCARRSWLLAELGPSLDFCARNPERLFAALSLDDRELIRALGGSRARELVARWESYEPDIATGMRTGAQALCHHDPRFPSALGDERAPRAVFVLGGVGRLHALASAPVVAIVGSERASDYGVAVAASVARGLSTAGVSVTGTLRAGVAAGAHMGALRGAGASIALLDGGLDARRPARLRALCARVTDAGCAVAELPPGSPARRWSVLACARAAAALAQVTILVEAHERPRELAAVRAAQSFERTVAAVPGRVTSPLSAAANALLASGEAILVRTAQDVLELLDMDAAPAAPRGEISRAPLAPELRATLDAVRAGLDTPQKLARECGEGGELLLHLSELELMGLLLRGDGGRYVPRDPFSMDA